MPMPPLPLPLWPKLRPPSPPPLPRGASSAAVACSTYAPAGGGSTAPRRPSDQRLAHSAASLQRRVGEEVWSLPLPPPPPMAAAGNAAAAAADAPPPTPLPPSLPPRLPQLTVPLPPSPRKPRAASTAGASTVWTKRRGTLLGAARASAHTSSSTCARGVEQQRGAAPTTSRVVAVTRREAWRNWRMA
eukprot:283910-Chlamydomonas_euryale.AAC.1